MELWGSGFNAWGQLDFQGESSTESRDLRTFKCVLRDQRIELLRTTLSALLVKTCSGIKVAGSPDDFVQLCITKQDDLSNVAIAGNDKVAEIKGKIVTQYDCLQSYLENNSYSFGEFEDFEQITANQTTFTALSKSGHVWTWGDGRYASCLGREMSEERYRPQASHHLYYINDFTDSPAHIPSIVEDLSDLPTGPIRKISSGGYVTAALTSGNDLYIWGGRPAQPKLLEQMSGIPEPVDLDGQDVFDVAVGVNHMLALTTEHKLYVVGANGNGQLGLDVEELSEWRQVSLPLSEKQQIESVHAGYKNSFVIVEKIT